MTSKRWNSTTKIIVTAILALLAVIFLITFRAMIRPTIIALLLTFILYQPVNWIQRRTAWSRGVSIISIYLLLILLLLVAPVLFIPRLVASFESLVSVLDTLTTDLQTSSTAPVFTLGTFELSINALFQQLGEVLQSIVSPAAAGALGFALTLTTTVLTTIYVLVLSFWLLKDMSKLQRSIVGALPTDYQEEMRLLARRTLGNLERVPARAICAGGGGGGGHLDRHVDCGAAQRCRAFAAGWDHGISAHGGAGDQRRCGHVGGAFPRLAVDDHQ